MTAPMPIPLREKAGNPSKRPIPKVIRPKPLAPEAPAGLGRFGGKLWKTLAPKLEPLGLLTEVDGPAFAALCMTYEIAQRARKELAKAELADKDTHNSRLRRHPAVQVQKEALRDLKVWLVEFGLTPAARARLAISGVPGDDSEDPDGLLDS